MRVYAMVLVTAASCGSGEAPKLFCHNVRIAFRELAAIQIANARDAVEVGSCQRLHEAVAELRGLRLGFYGAAVAFRGRSQVDETLQVLDKLTLDEFAHINYSTVSCADGRIAISTTQLAELRSAIDNIDTKLQAVVATCPR